MNEHSTTTTTTVPQGAIWVKNFKLRNAIANFISTRDVECPKCHSHFQDDLGEIEQQDLNETIVNHVMTVKIKTIREKYIAIYNPKKSLSTHPDYFLYVYQAYTGASAIYPFASSTPKSENRGFSKIQGQVDSNKNTSCTTGDIQSKNKTDSAETSTFGSVY